MQGHLIDAFQRYGLPSRILCDNGSPWGLRRHDYYTPLALWLLRLGIKVIHGRPRHPQTQGKDERFHATLIAEVLRWQMPSTTWPPARQRSTPGERSTTPSGLTKHWAWTCRPNGIIPRHATTRRRCPR